MRCASLTLIALFFSLAPSFAQASECPAKNREIFVDKVSVSTGSHGYYGTVLKAAPSVGEDMVFDWQGTWFVVDMMGDLNYVALRGTSAETAVPTQQDSMRNYNFQQ